MNRLLACAAALPALVLAGCASGNDYPSLGRRPTEGSVSPDPAICAADVDFALPDGKPERIEGTAQPAPAIDVPPPPQAPSANLTTRLAQLVRQAQTAHGRFTANRGQAERAVGAASGSAQGTDVWSNASLALSALESARSDAVVALAELDQRYGEVAVDGNDPLGEAAITEARSQVEAIVAEEDTVLTRLRSRLR